MISILNEAKIGAAFHFKVTSIRDIFILILPLFSTVTYILLYVADVNPFLFNF